MTATITGEGISGLPTRSDLARQRELAKYGLEISFYDALVESQQNLCADCHKPEKQKLGNAKRRPLGLGFGEDGRPNRLICTGCASKIRSAKARERKENEGKKFLSNDDWWTLQRQSLSQAQFEEFQAREETVLDLELMMTYHVNGMAGDFATPLETLIKEVERDAKANGLQYRPPELNFQESHAQIDFGEHSETRNYVMYGMCTAIDSQLYWDFILKFKPKATPRCMTPGCRNTQGKAEPWFCDPCSAERTRRSDAHHRGVAAAPREDRIYTIGGKWRTATDES